MRKIKEILVNILANTSLVLFLLVAVAIITSGISIRNIVEEGNIQISNFLQIFAANILLNVGLYFIQKFESRYVILEYFLGLSFTIIIVLVFGAIFEWFPESSWILVILAIMVYIFGLFANTLRTRKDAKEINELLKKRKKI